MWVDGGDVNQLTHSSHNFIRNVSSSLRMSSGNILLYWLLLLLIRLVRSSLLYFQLSKMFAAFHSYYFQQKEHFCYSLATITAITAVATIFVVAVCFTINNLRCLFDYISPCCLPLSEYYLRMIVISMRSSFNQS